MYRLWIAEDDMGIAEAIKTQAELWDMQVRYVQNFRNVRAMNLGADDFIAKPFDQSVLVASAQNL